MRCLWPAGAAQASETPLIKGQAGGVQQGSRQRPPQLQHGNQVLQELHAAPPLQQQQQYQHQQPVAQYQLAQQQQEPRAPKVEVKQHRILQVQIPQPVSLQKPPHAEQEYPGPDMTRQAGSEPAGGQQPFAAAAPVLPLMQEGPNPFLNGTLGFTAAGPFGDQPLDGVSQAPVAAGGASPAFADDSSSGGGGAGGAPGIRLVHHHRTDSLTAVAPDGAEQAGHNFSNTPQFAANVAQVGRLAVPCESAQRMLRLLGLIILEHCCIALTWHCACTCHAAAAACPAAANLAYAAHVGRS